VNKLLFYLLWPFIWFYAPLTRRVRVIIIKDNKVLLVKNLLGPGSWQFPGGGIKFSESVKSAGARELREELSVDITNIRELHDGFMVCRQYGLVYRLNFVSAELDTDFEIVNNHEIIDFAWLEVNDLIGVSTEVITGLKLAGK